MSYQVLARKWRPRRFDELVGQEHVVRPLINALEHGRLHHAFLFTGTRGVGKTTIARILAKSLNCETGVTAKPCGTCSACTEVDEGRFVDLIEVDAASRTKVDDTRELLDNVQYAPTRGRYKVYLIDEVHMLSGHSFNALLKTLEEPPPHVKFLLATTDPQKLPVTVLSRCLQFSLKRLSTSQIEDQLRRIMTAENIAADEVSLKLLARAADGSMRDGLSLLDQAIAFGAGQLRETEVRAMLGTIDQETVEQLLSALADGDARALVEQVNAAFDHNLDGASLLGELLRALHAIALAQVEPALADDTGFAGARRFAEALPPEDVQLYYQIGVMGQRDLPYSPEPRVGLEMTLLRMLAFRPASPADTTVVKGAPAPGGAVGNQTRAAASAPVSPGAAASIVTAAAVKPVTGTWNEVVSALKIGGLVRELANNTALESQSEDALALVLDEAHAQLLNKEREQSLRQALESYYGRPVRLTLRLGRAEGETPAREKQRLSDERQQAAEQSIHGDPNVRALVDQFNARVNPASIRPKA
jgi:DNA polymerase-3 subunit gamma/tau